MSTSTKASPGIITDDATFVGIDYHKRYSVWHAVDAAGNTLASPASSTTARTTAPLR